MSEQLTFAITKESVTVVVQGKTHTVQKSSANFNKLTSALKAKDWESAKGYLSVKGMVTTWSKDSFKIEDDVIFYKGTALPADLTKRILGLISNNEDPSMFFNFYERLQKNPSYRSVQQLWGFLSHENIPLTKDGCFLAYKAVNANYKDHHSGKWDNSPGVVNEMPRNQISDDPNKACHDGFHVGAIGYVNRFYSGSRIVVCKVDPEHVVCVPYDESNQKMRVCKYKVVGNYGDVLPSDSYSDDIVDVPTDKPGKAKVARKEFLGLKKFDKMEVKELLEQSIDDLRQYAGKRLHIVGASKIPGGKNSLVKSILSTRKGKK